MAWKVLFQLLCPDIPNLDEFNKFQQKVIGYAHPQQTHDHQINQGPACNNYSKTSTCRCFNFKGLNKYNLWSKFENLLMHNRYQFHHCSSHRLVHGKETTSKPRIL